MAALKRFWIEFERLERPDPLNLGCGVTAHNYDDALSLISTRIFPDKTIPTIVAVSEDVDVSTLDANHVLPNMGVVVKRGIWFPLGYEK